MPESDPVFAAKDFHLGADAFASDGVEVGKLVRILVDPDYKLVGLVVKEGARFSGHRLAPGSLLLADEVVVAKDAVKRVTHERIALGISSGDVRRLPPYLSYGEKGETVGEELEDAVEVLGSVPAVPHWLAETANKPDSELEIEGGENVMLGRTGRRLGTVKDVLFDQEQLVGVVLRPDGWFQKEVILPRRFLDRSDDAALFAQLDEKDLEHLAPFEPSA